MTSSLLRIVSVLGTGALALVGCTGAEVSLGYASGTVGISTDDAFVYAVDTDNGVVGIIDARTQSKITVVPVGKSPERITVGLDDTLYVANRGGRSVSVIRRGTTDAATWTELTRLNVGVEPVGLVLSPDGKTLYVVNSTSLQTTDYGTVMAFDTRSLQMNWELPVGPEPRSLAIVGNDRAVVTLFKQGDVALVDLAKPEVLQSGTALNQLVNSPTAQNPSDLHEPSGTGFLIPPPTFHARGMGEIVAGPNDRRVYALTSWSSEAILPDAPVSATSAPPPRGGGAAYGAGSGAGLADCSTSVVTAGVVTFADEGATPVVDSFQSCSTQGGIPPTRVVTASAPFQGPAALAIDPSGTWLFVAGRNSNNVAMLSSNGFAGTQGIAAIVNFEPAPNVIHLQGGLAASHHTGGPSGVAVSHDGTKLYVYRSFDHSLSVLEIVGGTIRLSGSISVAEDVLSPDAVTGRKEFFSAVDPGMTSPDVGVACASCHFDGREDGHVWLFSTGARRTPSLAGRATTLTAPFHWSGEFASLSDFLNDTIGGRMGGSYFGQPNPMTVPIAAYIDSLEPADNPHQLTAPSDAQVRGQAVFASAGCTGCHAGTAIAANGQTVQLFTNNGFANVGTLVTSGITPDDSTQLPTCTVGGVPETACLNVPSLLGLARTAPYLHDGSAPTLNDRLRVGATTSLHGQTANLTDQQFSDLVEYLNSL
jgi:YVTN family beta-propeller protein